jgi:hypothetical protein
MWVYAADAGFPRKVTLSDAKWLSVKAGRHDYFAVVHNGDGDKMEISVHSHSDVTRVVSRISLHSNAFGPPAFAMDGEGSVWQHLPHAFTGFASGDYWLILTDDQGHVELQGFDWFDNSYDKGYQGIIGVTETPDGKLLIISIQRDSTPVLYDPAKKQVVRKLQLADRRGNPEFCLRVASDEFWVSDYDSIVKLDAKTLDVLKAERIQDAASGTMQFIGKFCFNLDQRLCIVARPFSGDAIVLDGDSMRQTHRIKLGRQPLDIGWLLDGTVVARDWKTGEFLSHKWR